MIISASYKTDIPAFYGEWFRNRLRAGSCQMRNPYNRAVIEVPLTRGAVDGFVFWTKNLEPFVDVLEEVHARGDPFVVQYAINGYPLSLEHSVTDAARSVRHMRWLRERFGPKAAVWRYDPIVFSSQTPAGFHRANFEALARELEGSTDEVVVSFAQIYRKTKINLDAAARQSGFTWEDPPDEVKLALAAELVAIAESRGMKLTICSQRGYLVAGAADAACIDVRRLEAVAGRPIVAGKKGHRPECGCAASRDIGDYDTCPHGCAYCYAVQNHERARECWARHDPEGECLVV